jgi:murein L,D-transpeptidase YcbB/YkuD
MRYLALLAAVCLVSACASTGHMPDTGDASTEIRVASERIALAEEAGAATLVPTILATAKEKLATAQQMQASKDTKRAALAAREASAAAYLARNEAGRINAENRLKAAQQDLAALTPR